MRRAVAVAGLSGALLLPLLAVAPNAFAYGSDRMQLECADGRTLERSNGSSWWGVDHDAGYVTEHLLVESDGFRFEKDYGSKGNGERSTCVGTSFSGATWTVDLVRVR